MRMQASSFKRGKNMFANYRVPANRNENGMLIMEFMPALILTVSALAVSTLILIRLGLGLSLTYLIDREATKKASVANDYRTAVESARADARFLQTSVIGKLAALAPSPGFESSDGLEVVTTALTPGFFSYRVQANFTIAPLLDKSHTGFLGNIPGLSKGIAVVFVNALPAEHNP
jgi:hypothetical protein